MDMLITLTWALGNEYMNQNTTLNLINIYKCYVYQKTKLILKIITMEKKK
jgi:hypothetical protein